MSIATYNSITPYPVASAAGVFTRASGNEVARISSLLLSLILLIIIL